MAGIFAVYAYFYPPTGTLAYVTNTVRVVDREAATTLKVLDSAGNEIKQSVFATSVRLANTGTLPADSAAVRKPLTFRWGDAQIISIDPVNETKYGAIGATVFETDKGVQVGWKNFDPNQVIAFNVVYSSDEEQQPIVEGSVFPFSISEGRRPQSTSRFLLGILFFPAFIVLLVFMAFIGGRNIYRFYRSAGEESSDLRGDIMTLTFCSLIAALFSYLWIVNLLTPAVP